VRQIQELINRNITHHLIFQHVCCSKSEIVHLVSNMPIYTQSRGIDFIAYLCRYGC